MESLVSVHNLLFVRMDNWKLWAFESHILSPICCADGLNWKDMFVQKAHISYIKKKIMYHFV